MTHPDTLTIPRAVFEAHMDATAPAYWRTTEHGRDAWRIWQAALQAHPDTLQIPRAVVEQALEIFSEHLIGYDEEGFTTNSEEAETVDNLRAALQPQAAVDALVDAVLALAIPDGGDVSDIGAQAAPCDAGAIRLDCQPRGPNGECPDQQAVAPNALGVVARLLVVHEGRTPDEASLIAAQMLGQAASIKGLFIDMIAEHPGLAEELKAMDSEPVASHINWLPHDDILRFAQRVLESEATKKDRDDAAQMIRDLRRAIYKPQSTEALRTAARAGLKALEAADGLYLVDCTAQHFTSEITQLRAALGE